MLEVFDSEGNFPLIKYTVNKTTQGHLLGDLVVATAAFVTYRVKKSIKITNINMI